MNLRAFLIGFISTCILAPNAASAHDLKGLLKRANDPNGYSPQIQAALAELSSADQETRSVINNLRLWPVNRKLTVCFLAGNAAVRHRITESMKRVWPLDVLTQGRLSFDNESFAQAADCAARPTQDIRIDLKAGDGYWSYIGIESTRYTPSMNLEGFTETTPPDDELDRLAGHETGHALGLEHEHQSPRAPDCGWNFEYIYKNYVWKSEADMHANFDKLKDYIYHNVHAFVFSTYDKTSLMHYDFEAAAFKNGSDSPCFITRNFRPSDQDRLAITTAYGPAAITEIDRDPVPMLKGKVSQKTLDSLGDLLHTRNALLTH